MHHYHKEEKMNITATRYHDICAGHRVYGHEGKCSHFHGHNYRIYFNFFNISIIDIKIIKIIIINFFNSI